LPDQLKAVCQSKCSETAHPSECVFGCATDTWNCGHQLMNQMGTILQGAAHIASMVTGDEKLEHIADLMVQVSDFVFEVMPRTFRIVRDAIGITKDSESMAMSLVILYQYVIENAHPDGLVIASGTAEMLKAIAKVLAGKSSGDVANGIIDSGLISNIMKNGPELVEFGASLAKVFDYTHCELPTVSFTIEDAGATAAPGEKAIVGEWVQKRTSDDTVKYFQIDNRKICMRYERSQKAWQIYKDGWLGTLINRKVWYYASSENEQEFPLEGWLVHKGDEPPPNGLFTMISDFTSTYT